MSSQSGQGILEYILVLIVTVALVLGGIYQLNGAFKVWASNYFGDYIACLLETGDLPSIDGAQGDGGLCNQLFKPFSLADGRPLIPQGGGNGTGAGGVNAAGGARANRPGGGGSAPNSNPLRTGGSSAKNGGAGGGVGGNHSDTNIGTGNTGISSYGGGYSSSNRRGVNDNQTRLDNSFAFDKDKGDKQKRSTASSSKSTPGEGYTPRTIRMRPKSTPKDPNAPDDKGMTFGNFIKFLIIAAIIVALVVFIGGQMLQVGKSME